MTPSEALERIDSFAVDLQKMINSFCRDSTFHPDEYKNTITEIELYNKITTIQCRLIDLWDYLHKNKGRLV